MIELPRTRWFRERCSEQSRLCPELAQIGVQLDYLRHYYAGGMDLPVTGSTPGYCRADHGDYRLIFYPSGSGQGWGFLKRARFSPDRFEHVPGVLFIDHGQTGSAVQFSIIVNYSIGTWAQPRLRPRKQRYNESTRSASANRSVISYILETFPAASFSSSR